MKMLWILPLAMILLCCGCNKSDNENGNPVAKGFVAIGDPAPDFTLPSYPLDEFKLADYRGQQAVVLYFYPKDNTPDCTEQACAFRDTAQEFAHNGAVIVGVSQDDRSSHELFADEYDLPFPLLTDSNNKVRSMFGNPDGSSGLIDRITYVIDLDGKVCEVIHSREAELSEHVVRALAKVVELNSVGG